jgi:hypothetical protein
VVSSGVVSVVSVVSVVVVVVVEDSSSAAGGGCGFGSGLGFVPYLITVGSPTYDEVHVSSCRSFPPAV